MIPAASCESQLLHGLVIKVTRKLIEIIITVLYIPLRMDNCYTSSVHQCCLCTLTRVAKECTLNGGMYIRSGALSLTNSHQPLHTIMSQYMSCASTEHNYNQRDLLALT